MNCNSFENVVMELAREQMMEATARDAAFRHSSNCESCAARLNEEQQLTVGLKQLAASTQEVASAPELPASLLAEFRNQRLSVPNVVAPQFRTRNAATYWTYAAAAAALLIVSGITAIYLGVAHEQTPQEIVAPVANTPLSPTDLAAASVTTPTVSGSPTSPDGPRRSSKRATLAKDQSRPSTTTVAQSELLAKNNEREIMTEFIPIGYSDAPTVQDGGQLVRVELPRSTMARFGLPVNMERYDERVKADLWLGADGFARAIRFVQ
ncbi:MAG: hypothetical protein M3539_03295 [Acidobacteriota bacterium]|nr:hypothetical protein [Acidobacteriota bacterium]